jgi:hypothetical protein
MRNSERWKVEDGKVEGLKIRRYEGEKTDRMAEVGMRNSERVQYSKDAGKVGRWEGWMVGRLRGRRKG